jgi:transposase
METRQERGRRVAQDRRIKHVVGHYHLRSNVETTFSMIKRKFGGSVRSKSRTSQVNEILCKILCHNLSVLVHAMYELGVTPTFSERK